MVIQLTPSPMQLFAVEETRRAPKSARKRVNVGLADSTTKWRRSRGAPAKPKRRPNRRTIGKRVRRRHRRQA